MIWHRDREIDLQQMRRIIIDRGSGKVVAAVNVVGERPQWLRRPGDGGPTFAVTVVAAAADGDGFGKDGRD